MSAKPEAIAKFRARVDELQARCAELSRDILRMDRLLAIRAPKWLPTTGRIVAVLEANRDIVFKVDELLEIVGGEHDTTRKAIARLTERGAIRRVSHGHYAAKEQP